MLRNKLFKAFALLVVIFGILTAFAGIEIINRRVMQEAQNRVRLDLSSAWALYHARQSELETILRLINEKRGVIEMFEGAKWDDTATRSRLESIRVKFGFDFISLVTPDGQVVMRTAPPFKTGDFRLSNPVIAAALSGETAVSMELLSATELAAESPELAERAFLDIENTPKARPSPKRNEERGMVMIGACPIRKGATVLGAVYGGVLMNRNNTLVDRIQNVVFKGETYKDMPLGTATLFLEDSRIATTVRQKNGNRAIGTRVSREVAERVLDNGLPWVDEAFVVNDWYLTAYEPIRNLQGRIIGMLYVGILKRPFQDYGRSTILRHVELSVIALFVGLLFAYILASRIARPIQRLVEASHRMARGEAPTPVPTDGTSRETDRLIRSFNEMASQLHQRGESLKALNRSYMETLGFVSHELKSPVATITNYVYLMKTGKSGPLTEKQARGLRMIESSTHRLMEMVRHYLNLSRIENGELAPVKTRVAVLDDVLKPLLDAAAADAENAGMKITHSIGADTVIHADINMVREVFENLLSNALKYGRAGGDLSIRDRVVGGFHEFAVRNDGEGIPEDKIGLLFQKFSRINGTVSATRQKGTGLGLFITKHIVEAHGGTIGVSSKAGEWAEFTVSFPIYTEGTTPA